MDIQAWSIENWNKIPEADRKRCLDHLRVYMGGVDGLVILAKWRAQARSTVNGEPVRIGSDDIRFHFGVGMAIRNVLRQVVADDQLPGVEYKAGDVSKDPNWDGKWDISHNWDDFYIGAIHALATEPKKPDILDRLRRWQALKVGDPFPPELEGPNGWGPVLQKDITDAIAEIERGRQ